MAISEELRELVVAFGNAKYKQGHHTPPNVNPDAYPGAKEAKATFDSLCAVLEELEKNATNWDEHRCW